MNEVFTHSMYMEQVYPSDYKSIPFIKGPRLGGPEHGGDIDLGNDLVVENSKLVESVEAVS